MNDYMSARSARQSEWQKVLGPYERITQSLEDEWKKIEQGHKGLQEKQQRMAEKNGGSHVQDSDILDINAGGEIVRVTRGTLTQKKGTLLEALFSGRWEKQLQGDSKGCIFLDVNPTCFRCIVDYLNECKIAPPDSQPDLPKVDDENQTILSRLLEAFGFSSPFLRNNDSTILKDEKHVEDLANFLQEDGVTGSLELLYRGTRDGMDATSFHQKCDNKGPTVTITKTDDGYIFGGYADKAWTSSVQWVESDKAFLFALESFFQGNDTMKFAIDRDVAHAIYHNFSCGPCFGVGHDLTLLQSTTNYSALGQSYALPAGWNCNSFAGNRNFTLEEIEVFGIKESSSVQLGFPASDRANKTLDELNFDIFPESLRNSLQAEKNVLLGAAAELAALQDALVKEEKAVGVVFCGGDTSDIVVLNVSGRSMAVNQNTLARYPDSVFYKQFADPNWNRTASGKSKTMSPGEWSTSQVVEWIKTVQGLSPDICAKFRDVPGIELLALEREDIKDLGIDRPGTVALVMKAIQKLRNEEEVTSATFVEHSHYCIGKIIDHMRLKALVDLDIEAQKHPEIRKPDKKALQENCGILFPNRGRGCSLLRLSTNGSRCLLVFCIWQNVLFARISAYTVQFLLLERRFMDYTRRSVALFQCLDIFFIRRTELVIICITVGRRNSRSKPDAFAANRLCFSPNGFRLGNSSTFPYYGEVDC